MPDYAPPLSELLTLGMPDSWDKWPDYLARGFGPQHIPELIRMATDEELNQADDTTRLVWAPMHAWRILGLLRAAEAVEPLLTALVRDREVGGDLAREELPDVFAMIGRPAIEPLTRFLADQKNDESTRWSVATGLKDIAEQHSDCRAACVAALTQQLDRPAENTPTLNAALISELLELHEVAAAPVMERAFNAGLVEESLAGDWEDVRYELGLRPDRPKRKRYGPLWNDSFAALQPPSGGHSPKARATERQKSKRKEAKKARRRNRKK